MTPQRASAALLLASILIGACAAQPPPSSPSYSTVAQPSPPPPPEARPTQQNLQPGATAGATALPIPTAFAPFVTPGVQPTALPPDAQLFLSWMEVEAYTRQLQSSLTSCDTACKALASMERAVRVVCSLVKDTERPRCDEARLRLREARVRVRDACGQCSDGTRTDPDAPDP